MINFIIAGVTAGLITFIVLFIVVFILLGAVTLSTRFIANLFKRLIYNTETDGHGQTA